jgi:putative membrane protein
MRPLYFAAAFGAFLFLALNVWAGWHDVADAFARLGWGIALIVAARAIAIAAVGMGWWPLAAVFASISPWVCIVLRWVRDAINNLLPVAQVGGEIIGARLLARGGVPAGAAGATVLVDFSMQLVTQLLFTFIGLGWLVALTGGNAVAYDVLIGLLIFTPAVAGFFYLAHGQGGLKLVERGLRRIAGMFSLNTMSNLSRVGDAVQTLYERPGLIAWAFLAHMAVWFFGAVEIYIGLRFLGQDAHVSTAIVVESLGQAVKGAAFSVPGAVGVQEGGFVALCAIFGISPPVAIALSLAKRAPDLILGLPALAYWRVLERRGDVAAIDNREGAGAPYPNVSAARAAARSAPEPTNAPGNT